METNLTIIGGGLAGIYAAYLCEKQGLPYVLLDAKDYLGGRIKTTPNPEHQGLHHDVGPTWVFPHHINMQNLIGELGLTLFPQYTDGDVIYQLQNSPHPKRMQGAGVAPIDRIEGGTNQLINALINTLNPNAVKLRHTVTTITRNAKSWDIDAENDKQEFKINSTHVLLAMPPRIIARDFASAEWLSADLLNALNASQTWMSAQAKFVITYKSAFWREQGLAGQVMSQVGPMVEIHDATATPDKGFALFGFIGVPSKVRQQYAENDIKAACLQQLVDIFGDIAADYQSISLEDWALDSAICTDKDILEGSQHPNIDIGKFERALQDKRIYFAGSEFSTNDAGYLEGALLAVNRAMNALV